MLPDDRNLTGPVAPAGNSEAPTGNSERVAVDLAELDKERRVRGWSRTLLATRAGVTRPTIDGLYATGFASLTTFAKLADALDANPPSDTARRLNRELSA